MSRVKITTTLDEDLLASAKDIVSDDGLEGVNAVIEEALRIYFANRLTEVWEKQLKGGWLKKLIVRPDIVVFESIRTRKYLKRSYKYYTEEALQSKGFKQVWKMKKA